MSGKIVYLIMFALTLAYAKADGNELCPCDSNDNAEHKVMLDILLEKLSSNVNKDEELLYSVYPGLLNEYSCDCAEKQRRKRKIMPENPDELMVEAGLEDPVMKRSIHTKDRRCPQGTFRFAERCVKAELFEDYN